MLKPMCRYCKTNPRSGKGAYSSYCSQHCRVKNIVAKRERKKQRVINELSKDFIFVRKNEKPNKSITRSNRTSFSNKRFLPIKHTVVTKNKYLATKARLGVIRAINQNSLIAVKEAIPFYETKEWRELRYFALRKYGKECMSCGTKDAEFHVDHIKPRSIHPELELDPNNVQILCRDCNLGKSNKDDTDLRPGATL